ncbi:cysteine desulfurase family protein [Roseiterribacter gracilis]|uniref:Cysteine desulfurase n=1 Tax=Roseiterribacter gracilis TaxID=2812848 RepID=A0A8S8XGR1_9PROT|nr:cysteine desulfurase [Rhodospirillales bacterium TMPK1]
MAEPIYLDWNATAPLKQAAREAMRAALDDVGNASSPHGPGRRARRRVEDARAILARQLNIDPTRIVFTSGATEANTTALTGAHVLASAIEHPSVAVWAKSKIPVDARGLIDLDALDRMLGDDPLLSIVAVMAVNNETGVIQPIGEVADIVHRHGRRLHVDAVQAAGRLDLAPIAAVANTMSLSAHKLGGPQGIGALLLTDDLCATPLLRGGSQERRRRAGTENVAAIAGFGAAAAELQHDRATDVASLRDALEAGLKARADDLVIYGEGAPRVGNTSCFGAPDLPAETVLMALDLEQIAVSSGSACSSGAVEPSPVLLAMGVDPTAARTAIRVSMGPTSTRADIDRLLSAWGSLYDRRRRRAA